MPSIDFVTSSTCVRDSRVRKLEASGLRKIVSQDCESRLKS